MKSIIALFLSFAVMAGIGPILIPFLRKLKFGQTVRTEGVQAHLKKTGTPTMGGLGILLAVLVGCLPALGSNPRIIPVLVLTIGFGLIGFVDDYLKVVKKDSDGFKPKQKMICQIILTTIFVVYIWTNDPACFDLRIPFTGGLVLDMSGILAKIFCTVLLYFVVIGTVNGTNFTDGLDGLASGVTSVTAAFLFACSMKLGMNIEPVCAAMVGGLFGFLLYNAHPAKVFMGDTGSLALGGFIAGAAYMMQMPIYIVIFGLIYLVEVLSVMIQVTYFRKTGGKRFFKMAPIHHHFELCGWSETRIDTVFTIVTVLLCVIAYAAL
ncbi:MAG: phospho-N-acetylmuramoyl-pentapeptide-transferase [Lachnospiraceae bacterium]|nr:phospho-N-acetylmuramoyl-pentapeptide-transferase [Lachnospiraceae bacterium]